MRVITWRTRRGSGIRLIWLRGLPVKPRRLLLNLNPTSGRSLFAKQLKLEGLVIELQSNLILRQSRDLSFFRLNILKLKT